MKRKSSTHNRELALYLPAYRTARYPGIWLYPHEVKRLKSKMKVCIVVVAETGIAAKLLRRHKSRDREGLPSGVSSSISFWR